MGLNQYLLVILQNHYKVNTADEIFNQIIFYTKLLKCIIVCNWINM